VIGIVRHTGADRGHGAGHGPRLLLPEARPAVQGVIARRREPFISEDQSSVMVITHKAANSNSW